jgi:hypothetical protein
VVLIVVVLVIVVLVVVVVVVVVVVDWCWLMMIYGGWWWLIDDRWYRQYLMFVCVCVSNRHVYSTVFPWAFDCKLPCRFWLIIYMWHGIFWGLEPWMCLRESIFPKIPKGFLSWYNIMDPEATLIYNIYEL